MVSRFEIRSRYDQYTTAVAEANLISVGDESVDFPMKESYQNESFNAELRDISVNDSHNLLITNSDKRAGIRYMSPSLLVWLPVGLTEVLRVGICEDHEAYWWFTHDFSRAHAERYTIFPEPLIDNLELMIRLLTVSPASYSPPFTPETINDIIWQSNTLAAYIGFPTLEGFLKVACRRDIKMNGEIREGHKIRKLTMPHVHEYKHHDDGDGICSNIGMLMWHFEREVLHTEHRVLMQKMREAISDMLDHPPDRIYGLFNDYRNDSLHGRDRPVEEYGIILNYICLVVWLTLLPKR